MKINDPAFDIKNGEFTGGSYSTDDVTIPTSIYIPKAYDHDKKYALLIYFHNIGGRGDTPYWSGDQGNILVKNVIELTNDNVIVFAPRCPTEYFWVDTPYAPGIYDFDKTPVSKVMRAVISYIENEILAKYSVDTSRVWAFGDSLGGGATWDLLLRKPDLLAAAIPVASYCDPTQAENIPENIAIWAFHTAQDKSVSVNGIRALMPKLAAFRRNVKYTEYDSADPDHKALFNGAWEKSKNWEHWAWVPAYNDIATARWLVSQAKPTCL
ncbi:MAG: hypothetical protein IJ428_01310 [Clostridia bacterium]|nr:hypothetical protein [Clostridia bacterium]